MDGIPQGTLLVAMGGSPLGSLLNAMGGSSRSPSLTVLGDTPCSALTPPGQGGLNCSLIKGTGPDA